MVHREAGQRCRRARGLPRGRGAGNPAFLNGCSNVGGVYETAAFFKDRQGIVHLKGAVTCPGTSQTVFHLPPR